MWAANLFAAREKAGFSQAQLAKRVGVSQTAISQHECGVTSPTVELQARLAYTLKTTPQKLFPHPTVTPDAFV